MPIAAPTEDRVAVLVASAIMISVRGFQGFKLALQRVYVKRSEWTDNRQPATIRRERSSNVALWCYWLWWAAPDVLEVSALALSRFLCAEENASGVWRECSPMQELANGTARKRFRVSRSFG